MEDIRMLLREELKQTIEDDLASSEGVAIQVND